MRFRRIVLTSLLACFLFRCGTQNNGGAAVSAEAARASQIAPVARSRNAATEGAGEAYLAYLVAVQKDDVDAASVYVPADKLAMTPERSELLSKLQVLSPLTDPKIVHEETSGDTSTLHVTARVAENYGAGTVLLRREGERWKVVTELWNMVGEVPSETDFMAISGAPAGKTAQQRAAWEKIQLGGNPEVTGESFVGAAVRGNLELVQLFLDAGLPVDSKDESGGTTPLLAASQFHNTEVALLLVEKGANVNMADENHATPLLHAAEDCKSAALVRALIAKRADVNAKAAGGATPLMMARLSDCKEIVSMLEKAGAREK